MLFPFSDNIPSRSIPLVTIAIIVLNAVVFLWSQTLPPLNQEILGYHWGFMPARIHQLQSHRPIVVVLGQQAEQGWPWQAPKQFMILQPQPAEIALTLVTCLFLHGGWLHLLSNLWFLWIFGDNVEDRLGHLGFLFFYLFGGLAASLTHWLVFPDSQIPVIGASGAIAAVLGGYAVTWPWARVNTLVFLFIFITIVPLPALLVLGAWFLIQILSGLSTIHQDAVQSVAWWAHIGGFAFGMLLMPLVADLLGNDEEPTPANP